jgi:predicted branched-subunit amino acid permease
LKSSLVVIIPRLPSITLDVVVAALLLLLLLELCTIGDDVVDVFVVVIAAVVIIIIFITFTFFYPLLGTRVNNVRTMKTAFSGAFTNVEQKKKMKMIKKNQKR